MAAAAPPETARPAAAGTAYEQDDQEEEECLICRLPAEADRPLRHPCACHGSIWFVHDDCQFRWMATRLQHQCECEVCKRTISTRPLYAADAPARLPVSEFVLGAPGKIISQLLPLFVAICVVRESALRLATVWTWRVALARTFAQVHHLLSLCLSTTSIIASIALLVAFVHKGAPYAVAPYTRWVERLEARRLLYRGFDVLQAVALVDHSMMVLIADMVLACIFGFLPFSLGRIILWFISCFNLCNVDELGSYTSTASVLLIGYGFIFSVAVTSAGLYTFRQYLTGERFRIAIFLTSVCGTFFRGIMYLVTLANTCLDLLNSVILHPLIFGWLLDICTSKMFGATMSERFKLLIASSFACNALHWLIGNTILSLRPKLSELLHQILWRGVTSPFAHHDVCEPFFKLNFKKLPGLFVDIIFVVLVILIPVKIVVQLAPEVFPLDITYFNLPAKGTPFWQGLRYCAESLSDIYHLKFLIGNTVLYLEWLVQWVRQYWFVTAGESLGNTPKDQYGSGDEVNDKRRLVAVGTMPRVMLALWSVVIFNSMLFFSISVGRRFLFAIPQLLVADLFALAVGFCIISTIIAATRDSFACMTSGGKRLLALEMHLLFFIWIVIIPLLIGLLVDLSLLSLFTGPDDDVPALGFFCTWFLGRQLQNIALYLAPWERIEPFIPCMAYFVDSGSWDGELWWATDRLKRVTLIWLLQDELLPITTKLLTALGVPYLLAKGIFPRLGYSVAVNSTVYHFAWLGSLALCVLCYLAKVFFINLRDSIRDDRYTIGRRLEDVADSS